MSYPALVKMLERVSYVLASMHKKNGRYFKYLPFFYLEGRK